MTSRIVCHAVYARQWRLRRCWLGLGLALLLAGLALLAPAALSAQTTGAITGKVVNGTQGGGRVDGLEVQLHTLAHDTAEPTGPPISTRVDAQGAFSFGGLATGGKNGYVVASSFQGVVYASDLAIFQSGETTKTVELKVYEPTNSAEAVTVRQHHLVVEVDAERKALKLLDISVVLNRGDTTFVGKPAGAGIETFRLALPSGAREIELDAGLAENTTAPLPGGLIYTEPILPGEKALVLTYLLDYTSPTLTLTKTLSLPTDSVDLLVADRGVKVAGAQFTPQPNVELRGQQYLRVTRKGVAPDSPIVLEFSDLPGVGLGLNPGQWPVAAGLALLVGAGTYVVAIRRRPVAARPPRIRLAVPHEPDDVDEPDEPDDLVEATPQPAARRPAVPRLSRARAAAALDEPDDEDLLEP